MQKPTTTETFTSTTVYPLKPIARLLEGAKFERELQSSITTDWRVSWSPQECARDLFQNFRDANANVLDRIEITTADDTAIISAPASMHLEHAFFLGSTKAKEAGDIGQFGEGLKVALLCLLRDHGADVVLASGNRAARIQLGDKIPQLQLRPMVYRFFQLDPSRRVEGTRLILENVPTNVQVAVKNSPNDFFHPDHPLLGEVIAGNHDKVLIARTKDNAPGCIFYRNLKRADLSLPLICAVNKSYAAMEKLIGRDRDRTAFGENVLTTLYRLIANSRVIGSSDSLTAFLRATEKSWENGHPLISAVLNAGCYSGAELSEIFGDRYYCTDYRISSLNGSDLIVVRDIEESWKLAGRRCLPGYFRNAGVRSAMNEWEGVKRRSREEAERALQQQRRGPTQAERACIDLLEQFLRDLDSSLADVVLRDVSYLIAETDDLLGAWQRSRVYKSREIFLAAKLFSGPLRTAFATLLHEASHLFGTDGSRGFTDSLTGLVERIFGHTRRLRAYKKTWMQLRKQVQAERAVLAPAASPAAITPSTTADDVYQMLISAAPQIANAAVIRFVCEHDDGTLAQTVRGNLTWEELEELGIPTSCGPRPSQSRWLPAETLAREWLGEEPSPLEAALRLGMRRARQRVTVKGGSSRRGVLATVVTGTPQPDQPAVAVQSLSTPATPSIAAAVAEGATAA